MGRSLGLTACASATAIHVVVVLAIASLSVVLAAAPTPRNCLTCIVMRESVRRAQNYPNDVMSCASFEAMFAARHWPADPNNPGGGGATTMAQAYPAVATAGAEVTCAEIRDPLLVRATRLRSAAPGPTAKERWDWHRLSGEQHCSSMKLCDAQTFPVPGKVILPGSMHPGQQRAVDVQWFLAYARGSLRAGEAAALEAAEAAFGTTPILGPHYADAHELQARFAAQKALYRAPHTHIVIAFDCVEDGQHYIPPKATSYLTGWSVKGLRDKTQPAGCSAGKVADMVIGQSRFWKEKYGMCVEGDAVPTEAGGGAAESKRGGGDDKAPEWPGPLLRAEDLTPIREAILKLKTDRLRPAYGSLLWYPGLFHTGAPESESTYGHCAIHLRRKFNEASVFLNADARALGCLDAPTYEHNKKWDCLAPLGSYSTPPVTDGAFRFPYCVSGITPRPPMGSAPLVAVPSRAFKPEAKVRYTDDVYGVTGFKQKLWDRRSDAEKAADAKAERRYPPFAYVGQVGMTEVFVHADIKLHADDIQYLTGNFVKDFCNAQAPKSMHALYAISASKQVPVRWVWTMGNLAHTAVLPGAKDYIVPDYAEYISLPAVCIDSAPSASVAPGPNGCLPTGTPLGGLLDAACAATAGARPKLADGATFAAAIDVMWKAFGKIMSAEPAREDGKVAAPPFVSADVAFFQQNANAHITGITTTSSSGLERDDQHQQHHQHSLTAEEVGARQRRYPILRKKGRRTRDSRAPPAPTATSRTA